jgi:mannose/fructose/N-acetylgalactosamine-specific phosphotransferase system component IIC
MSKILIASFLGSILSLDVTILGNFMISRPIVAGPIIGYFLGDMKIGIEIGILFEMFFSDIVHVGAAIPINVTMLTALVLGCESIMPGHGNTITMFVIVMCIPIGYIFRQVEMGLRSINSKISHSVDRYADHENPNKIYIAVLKGIIMFFSINFILLLVAIPLTSRITKALFFNLSGEIIYSLKIGYALMPIIGFAVLFNNFFQTSFRDIIRDLFSKVSKRSSV